MSTAQQLQRALEERAKEITELQNKVRQYENDRVQWSNQRKLFESRQPPDIQQLMAQKRELQQQLQREESEKQELFMQINQLIGEIADSRSKPVAPDLSDENGRLKAQVSQLSGENENLQREISTTKQKLREELENERNQLNVMRRSHNLEVERLKDETQRYIKELENSNAAIQSLKLAKSLSNDSNLQNEVNQLKSQVESLTRTNQDLSSYKVELEQNLAHSKEINSQLERRISDLESRYRDLSSRNSSLFIKLGLSPQSDVDLLERKIDGLREEKENEVNKRKTLETEVSDLRKTLNSSNSHQADLTRQINDLKAENTRLQDSESLEDELHTLVASLQAAKEESTTKDSEISQWRSRAINLDEQIVEQKEEILRLRQLSESSDRELQNLRANAVDSEIIKGLEDRLKTAKIDAENERQKLAELRSAKQSLEDRLQRAENELKLSADKSTRLEANLTKISRDLEAEKAAKMDLEKLFVQKTDDLEEALERVAELTDELRLLEEDSSSTSSAFNQIASTLQVAPEPSKILEELSKRASRLQTLESQLSEGDNSRRKLVEEMQNQIENLEKERNANLRELKEATARCNEHAEKVERLEKENKEELVLLKNEVNRLKSRELDLEQDLDRFKRSEQALSERLRTTEQELSRSSTVDGAAMEKINMLEADLEEMGKQNSILREKALSEQRRYDDEMRNMRDEMIENIRRLSDLLESETKRLQAANNEREHWEKEARDLKNALSEQRRLLEEKPRIPETDSELKARCEELMRENAELAADLLKKERFGGDGESRELRELEQKYLADAQNWRRERMALENQIEELRSELNSQNNPKPKPRKINGYSTLPSHTSIPASETSSADESTATLGSNGTLENGNVHAELERQKRLVNVLRRKLQHQQIERFQQSRSFCATMK